MKKLALAFLLITPLLFSGCLLDQEENTNENDNQNTNQSTGSGDFSGTIPTITLEEGQSIVETDDGWGYLEDENATEEIGEQQDVTEDEWKGDPAQVLFEFYFKSKVSGEALNQSHRVIGLHADLTGIIVVYQDGSVGGTGNIAYTGTQGCKIQDPASQTILSCEFKNSMDGTFNIDGQVVYLEEDYGKTHDNWPSGHYWLELNFLEGQVPIENVEVINNYTGGSSSVDNKDLHLVLFAGLFSKPQYMSPYFYNQLSKDYNNSYATSHVTFEFINDFGSEEIDVLREEMGLKVQ